MSKSKVPPLNPIIIIDDDDYDENDMEIEMERSKNPNVEKSNVTDLIENEEEQSSAQKSDLRNSDSVDERMSQNLTRTFAAMIGALHGMSLKDVNKMMESEKDIVVEFQNAINTVSKIFKNSSDNEIPMDKEDSVNTSRNKEIPSNISFNTSANKEKPVIINSLNIPNNKEIPVNFRQVNTSTDQGSSINKEKIPANLQQDKHDNVLMDNSPINLRKEKEVDISINKKLREQVKGISENSQNITVETLSHETRLPETSVRNASVIQESSHVNSTKVKQKATSTQKSSGSGIKIGDNWELPIILVDSDDDYENEVIEIDTDEELKQLMSLDDFDCIEIDKDEFEVVVNAKKGDNEIIDDSDDETFIPIVPEFNKRRRSSRLRAKRAKLTAQGQAQPMCRRFPNNSALKYLSDNDPSRWRKDLPAFPYITNAILRTWATGFLPFRSEWERLEFLGDKVLMFCVLRFATAKYLQYYTPSDIKTVTTFLVSNKLLAAYSLTLGLNKQNQMENLGITKRVADAFEAYIGAYYLSDGEEATTRYLNLLMSPLFELVLTSIQTGRNPQKIMSVMANYFSMDFLITIPKLKG